MEKVYSPANFDCTKKLTNLKDSYKSYSAKVFPSHDDTTESFEEAFKQFCGGIDDNYFKTLSETCSENSLTVENEIKQTTLKMSELSKFWNPFVTNNAKSLSTVNAKLEEELNFKLKKKELGSVNLDLEVTPIKHIRPGEEIIVHVKVYKPFGSYFNFQKEFDSQINLNFEIIMLGSQTLDMLSDKILCEEVNDFYVQVDNINHGEIKKETISSCLFCINDVVYLDIHQPDIMDTFDKIKRWGEENDVATFTSKDMASARIDELNFMMGYPYCYRHNDCEHILIFSDLRLISTSDSLCKADYPQYIRINEITTKNCNMCNGSAEWLCTDCDRLPNKLTFLCKRCLLSYNYIDNKKIGNFKLYKHVIKDIK